MKNRKTKEEQGKRRKQRKKGKRKSSRNEQENIKKVLIKNKKKLNVSIKIIKTYTRMETL